MHYALWALGTAEDIEARGAHAVLDALVAYFDMGREVDPYEVPCLCLSPDPQADCEDGTWYVNDELDDGARNSTEPEAPRTVQVAPRDWGQTVETLLGEHEGFVVVVADMHA